MLTLGGREFPYPFKKRVNFSGKAITDEFVRRFVDFVDRYESEPGVHLVVQMGLGGGAYLNEAFKNASAIPHRDFVHCLAFDVFYEFGFEPQANEIQRELQVLLDAHFHPDGERRVFWGSFGDTNISDPEISRMYYDDADDFHKLRQIKHRVDRGNLFRTDMTVPPLQD